MSLTPEAKGFLDKVRNLALPARPVRVGDMVFDSRRDKARKVSVLTPGHAYGAVLEVGGPGPCAWIDKIAMCRHEDGAPIDVEASLAAAKAQGMRLVDWCNAQDALQAEVFEQHDRFVFGVTEQVVIEAQKARIADLEAQLADVPFDVAKSEKRIAVRDQIIKDLEAATRGAEERANRLGDEAGRLDSLTRELAIENSNLRRQLDAAKKGGKR